MTRIDELYAKLEDSFHEALAEGETPEVAAFGACDENEDIMSELNQLGHTQIDVETNLRDVYEEAKDHAAESAEYEQNYL